MKAFKIKIYADGAVLEDMLTAYQKGVVSGFTTNPSLMKKAGVTNYVAFAKEVLAAIPDLPISFEVFSDDFAIMQREAEEIASWGNNVYVKIPITNAFGDSSIPLIQELSKKGIKLNVTAIFTLEQVRATVDAFAPDTENIVSVFAGRIADTGVDPIPTMKAAAEICREKPGTELLWASSRELLNIFQAEASNCDIITCTPEILNKLSNVGKDLEQLSLETVQMFSKDSAALGFTVLR
ncbi:transaldolase [Caldibacillus lycopersici]|uniref:Transaldolase n=1 Tax=Perspicuibacillus lycopersici TaxID=1325689 RepID=A0AAE3LQ70_9BACI|nr:transaldolase [Perspicuibacillus lycopersici]MCU9613134.1 transaldolase [Perspicuibacillus lycopersici]